MEGKCCLQVGPPIDTLGGGVILSCEAKLRRRESVPGLGPENRLKVLLLL